jgi:hypothetical protein
MEQSTRATEHPKKPDHRRQGEASLTIGLLEATEHSKKKTMIGIKKMYKFVLHAY